MCPCTSSFQRRGWCIAWSTLFTETNFCADIFQGGDECIANKLTKAKICQVRHMTTGVSYFLGILGRVSWTAWCKETNCFRGDSGYQNIVNEISEDLKDKNK